LSHFRTADRFFFLLWLLSIHTERDRERERERDRDRQREREKERERYNVDRRDRRAGGKKGVTD